MKIKYKVMLALAIFCALCGVGALMWLLVPQDDSDHAADAGANQEVVIEAYDIDLKKYESRNIIYTVMPKESKVTITTTSNIIKLVNSKITAVDVGTAKVTLTAYYEGTEKVEEITVKVVDLVENISIKIYQDKTEVNTIFKGDEYRIELTANTIFENPSIASEDIELMGAISKDSNLISFNFKTKTTNVIFTLVTENKNFVIEIPIEVLEHITDLELKLERNIIYPTTKNIPEAELSGFYNFTTVTSKHEYTLKIEDDTIVTNNTSKIVALSIGKTKLIFTSTQEPDYSETYTIEVKDIPVTDIQIQENLITLKPKESYLLKPVKILPSYTTDTKEVSIEVIGDIELTDNIITATKLGTGTISYTLNNITKTIEVKIEGSYELNFASLNYDKYTNQVTVTGKEEFIFELLDINSQEEIKEEPEFVTSSNIMVVKKMGRYYIESQENGEGYVRIICSAYNAELTIRVIMV